MTKKQSKQITECRICERPLRPNGAPAYRHPGTTVNRGRGFCSPCYDSEVGRAERLLAQPLKATHAENVAGLLGYFESRKPFRRALGQTYFPDPFDAHANTPDAVHAHLRKQRREQQVS